MLIFDGDYPMAHGGFLRDRDLTRPIAEVRAATDNAPDRDEWPARGVMASLPEMRRGRVAAALVKIAARIQRPGNPLPGHRTAESAYASARGQLAYYEILERRGEARILRTRGDLTQHMRAWSDTKDPSDLPIGFIIGMECADPILWPEHVHDWWELGLRTINLAHYGVSTYAHGTGTPGPLRPAAKPLLREMATRGLVLDLTHTADEAFWQALDLYTGPVMASHQNCRALVPGARQFSDEQLTAILARDAVIGVALDTWMLYPKGDLNWGGTIPDRRTRFPRAAVTIEDVADHLDHICQLAGDARHAGIGGDTDGQGGADGAPLEIDTVADYQKIAGVLERRGYNRKDVENVMYRKWQRFYETYLPA